MRDFGVLPSAQDAFLLDLGLQTLPVRMAQHCKNAQRVAEYLKDLEEQGQSSTTPACQATASMKRRKSTCPAAAPASSPSPSAARARTPRALWMR